MKSSAGDRSHWQVELEMTPGMGVIRGAAHRSLESAQEVVGKFVPHCRMIRILEVKRTRRVVFEWREEDGS